MYNSAPQSETRAEYMASVIPVDFTSLPMPPRGFFARLAWLLDYEPTWFPEFASGLAVGGWALAATLTDDYERTGSTWIMPALGMVFGPIRWTLLFKLRYVPRVLAAAIGSVWWGCLFVGVCHRLGFAPSLGPMGAVLLLDVLTLCRFSMPCTRDLILEWKVWRGT